MSITRRWQSGFELQTLDEFSSTSGSPTISNTKAKSDAYSFRVGGVDQGLVSVAATAQLRMAMHINHLGASAGDSPLICSFRNGGSQVLALRYNSTGALLELLDDAGVLASVALGDLSVQNVWNHLSIDFKIDAAGWASVRLNGSEVIAFSGDTNDGGATVNTVVIGNDSGATVTWANYIYYDDIYIDDTAGEGAASVPPDLRYHLLTPNADGTDSQWDGSDGNSVNNYLLVDDVPKDDETTYVSTDVDGEQDFYGMSTYPLGAGETFVSVIPYMYVRKEDGASAAQVKLNLSDGSNESFGTLQTPSTSYTLKSERFVLAPDGGAWAQADVNALQVGVEINV